MRRPRVYADFMKLDDDGRSILRCRGALSDLSRLGLSLHEGLELTFYMDDADDDGNDDPLLVDGVVRYSERLGEWGGELREDAWLHASEEP